MATQTTAQTTTLHAIETKYAGCLFRSRLEARYAVAFDALGVTWQYEAESYDVGAAGWYLPDFYLPDHNLWVEVKPKTPKEIEIEKIHGLHLKGIALEERHQACIVVGVPGDHYTVAHPSFSLTYSEDINVPKTWLQHLVSPKTDALCCPMCQDVHLHITGRNEASVVFECANGHTCDVEFVESDEGFVQLSLYAATQDVATQDVLTYLSSGVKQDEYRAISLARKARFEQRRCHKDDKPRQERNNKISLV